MSSHENKNFSVDLRAIGRRIREIRGVHTNQRDFGKVLGIRQAQLSKYERGQSAPTLEMLLKLKAHSGRSVDWILTGIDPVGKEGGNLH